MKIELVVDRYLFTSVECNDLVSDALIRMVR